MIRFASALPLVALLAPVPLAAQSAGSFQLPPAETPSPDSRVQGPVDTDAPVPIRPRAIATATPATSAPTPAPTPAATASPTIVLPAASQARPPAAQPAATRTVAAQATPTVAPTLAPPLASPSAVTPSPVPLPTAGATAAPVSSPEEEPAQPLPWPWITLGAAAVAAIAGFLMWRRRRAVSATPEIVVPNVTAPAAIPGEALAIAVEAMRMDRSVLNATVGYRITIRNRTAQALNSVAVEADLVSASRDRPTEQQLALPGQALTPRHAAERLAPGQSLRFEGQVRLPLSEASAIWQGRVGLLVPLLRVRATAAGAAPVATTLVIGRAEGSSARPQPFRLDEPPRSYAPLAQRVLDAVPARA